MATIDDILGDRDEHPSYGIIQLSKISSTGTPLVGSPLLHHSVVGIKISTAFKGHEYGHDNFYAEDLLLEINMSEHQWATFVSSFGVGGGTPVTLDCRPAPGYTLQHVSPPPATSPRGAHTADVSQALTKAKAAIDTLNGLMSSLAAKPVAKVKKADIENLHNAVTQVNNWLTGNLPFVQQCFEEAMEKTIASAKAEVAGFTTNMIVQAGLEHLGAKAPTLEIDHE
ncbi:hypothetical protein [Telmatospirillum sp.]|uniref:hypothetical protein n=1 Tax=Telmatospirillum sp. TaxID=2079197 RepID=UPI00283D3F4E|nr:hypothetical protein [Telmatospirillum sp.]MDR3436402.1 hypothetical protein [Telmatospirillum sp.]